MGGDYVATPAVAGDRLAAGFTVGAWVRDLFPGERSAYVAGMTGEGVTAWQMGTDAGTFGFQVAGTGPLLAQSRFDHTLWHHVVASYAAGEMRLYVDGRLQNVRSIEPIISPTVHLWFGAFRDGTRVRHLGGSIDEVRLWARALDTSEIKRNAAYRLVGREPGLVGCWEMADGPESLPDRTPSRRTAVARFEPGGMTFDGASSWGWIDLTAAGLLDAASLASTIGWPKSGCGTTPARPMRSPGSTAPGWTSPRPASWGCGRRGTPPGPASRTSGRTACTAPGAAQPPSRGRRGR